MLFRRLAIIGLAVASIHCAFAAAAQAVAGGERHAAFALDANTGAVLYSDDGDAVRHPASLTKMMTLYLTFETIESGRLSMSDRVVISPRAAGQAPSKLDLDVGQSLTVEQAVRALITKSANDIAVALAEKIGGTEANFAMLMNKRARDLGMKKTNFENASGLPNAAQVTTARDMVTLGMRLQDDFPTYYSLFKTRTFAFRGKSYRNHNTLLRTYQGTDGIKTGYTRASGFNLVSSVRRGRRHVIAAVFGGSSAAKRNAEMHRLLNRTLARASSVKTRKPRPMYIAKLKSPPKVAHRPAPRPKQVAMAAPRFAPEAAPPVRPAREPLALASPQPPAAAAPADAGPPIDIFKVKRVLVAPQPEARPEDMTDMAARESDDAPGLPALRPATYEVAAAPQRETVIAKTTPGVARLPSTLGQQMAMLGARDAIEAQLMSDPDRPVATASAPASNGPGFNGPASNRNVTGSTPETYAAAAQQRGRRPSSLQAQAAQFAPPAQQRVAALEPSPGLRPAAPRGRYEIQIGAYRTIADAQAALTSTQTKAGSLLSSYASVTHPVMIGGKQIYRARFAGFDANHAASTCTELRRRSIDCFVMTAE